LKVVGGTRPAQCRKIFVVALHFLGSTSTSSRFGERFRDGQYTLVSFFVCCSSTHGAPGAHLFVKVGARASIPYGVGTVDCGTTESRGKETAA